MKMTMVNSGLKRVKPLKYFINHGDQKVFQTWESDIYGCQILTSNVGLRTERVNIKDSVWSHPERVERVVIKAKKYPFAYQRCFFCNLSEMLSSFGGRKYLLYLSRDKLEFPGL